MESSINRGSFRATVEAEHRDGYCENCEAALEKEFYMDGERKRVRMICPKCGGQGRLIAKSVSIQAPSPPQCVRIKCLVRFVSAIAFCGLLTIYHRKRFTYAERNRHKKIPQKYRTGENSPTNIRQAIFAIIKLTIIGGTRQWHKLKLSQTPG